MKPIIFLISLAVCHAADAASPPVTTSVVVESHGLKVRADGVGKEALADVKTVVHEQAALTKDDSVTAPLADDLAFFVRQRYLELGYRDVAVTWDISGDTALLHVNEGVSYKVGTVTYKGNASQSPAELTKYLMRPTHEKLNTSTDHPPCVEADLREGADLVKRFFQAKGFIEAAVTDPIFTPHRETGMVDVLVEIREGRRYVFGQAYASGELDGQERAVHKEIKDLRGQDFSESKIENARKRVLGIFQQRGFVNAAVNVIDDPARHRKGAVSAEFHVTPGVRFRIAQVEIAPGFSAGAQRLVNAGFTPAKGKIYSPAVLEVMNRRLLDTEVFARLDVKPRAIGEDTLALDLSGEEAKRTTLSAYVGYETFQGPIFGFEDRQVNFMNTGDALRIKAEINGRGYNGSVKWIDPAIFNSAWAFDAEIAAQTFSVFDYERRTVNVRSTLSRHWDRHITSTIFAEGSTNRVTSEELTPEELGPADYKIATAGFALTLDYRDSPVLPTKGWFAGLTVADTLGGDIRFLRTDAVFSYYQPIVKHLRAAFSARTSALNTREGLSSVPIDLRLFNGGANSVRSFAERDMGAHSKSGTPLGGTLTQVFNAELSYEVVSNLEFAIFADAGRLSSSRNNPFSVPVDMRYAVGAGLRYKLPFGPIRVDYGYNPKRRDGEAVGAFHITFGYAF